MLRELLFLRVETEGAQSFHFFQKQMCVWVFESKLSHPLVSAHHHDAPNAPAAPMSSSPVAPPRPHLGLHSWGGEGQDPSPPGLGVPELLLEAVTLQDHGQQSNWGWGCRREVLSLPTATCLFLTRTPLDAATGVPWFSLLL